MRTLNVSQSAGLRNAAEPPALRAGLWLIHETRLKADRLGEAERRWQA
jgi:hypothetical protein